MKLNYFFLCLFSLFFLKFNSINAQKAELGEWSQVYEWPAAAVHMSVLPNGKVLIWDDTSDDGPGAFAYQGPYHMSVWDPISNTHNALPILQRNPSNKDMFCGPHTSFPNGNVLAATGTIGYNDPLTQIYDWKTDMWVQTSDLNKGRYYPSATTLADGTILMTGGYQTEADNSAPEIYKDGSWDFLENADLGYGNDPQLFIDNRSYFPWTQVAPNGKVFYAGPEEKMRYLNVEGEGSVEQLADRDTHFRDYGSYAMYDIGKILVAGGGNSPKDTYKIDINGGSPVVNFAGNMAFGRRQQNLTILADGSVAVSGGNSAGADYGANNAFNKGNQYSDPLATNKVEIWNPDTNTWTVGAEMERNRQYHSTAVLLPDGRLVHGGGICDPCKNEVNGEIYSPPYLFNGDGGLATRPVILEAPEEAGYKMMYDLRVDAAGTISKVHLIKLSSVTHATNFDQRLVPLDFSASGTKVSVNFPENSNIAPPGYYMLIVVNSQGTPSVAKMVKLSSGKYVETGVKSFQSFNFPEKFITHDGLGNIVKIITQNNDDLAAEKEKSSFKIVPGLADPTGVSFESVDMPGHYLSHYGFVLQLKEYAQSAEFKNNSTFYQRPGLADNTMVSYESKNYPNYYIRHQAYELGVRQFQNNDTFKGDATFKPTAPRPGQNMRLESHNYPNFYASTGATENLVLLEKNNGVKTNFTIVPGLGDPAGISFRSVVDPNSYWSIESNQIVLKGSDTSPVFNDNSTFYLKRGYADPNKFTLESKSNPGSVIAHYNFQLTLVNLDDNSDDFSNAQMDATWNFKTGKNIEPSDLVVDVSSNGTKLSLDDGIAEANGIEEETVIVQLKSASGDDIIGAGYNVTFSVTGNAVLSNNTVQTDETGSASITVINTVIETVEISATVDTDNDNGVTPEVAIKNGSPAQISFTSGPADPSNANTQIIVSGTGVANGVPIEVLVQLADANGNLVMTGGGDVILSATGDAELGAVKDNGDGTYTATIKNFTAESVTVSASLNGVTLTNQAFIVFETCTTDCDQDKDGVLDSEDLCPNNDDKLDEDGDSIPDGCDICAGSDDKLDLNGNNIPDGCEGDVQTFESINWENYYITHQGIENQVGLILQTDESLKIDRGAVSFKIVPGLGDNTAISFESIDNPGYYLAHYGYVLKLRSIDDLVGGKEEDATFFQVPGLADPTKVSFQSKNFPNRYIRHENFQFLIVPFADTEVYKNDATFLPSGYEIVDCVDSDNDGVCDTDDVCDGFDDTLDVDGDGVPDGCDVCEGSDDTVDVNGNNIPDGCEADVQFFESINWTDYYISHQGIENQVELLLKSDTEFAADREQLSFKIVPGLGDNSAISFESIDNPGHYLAHYDYVLKLRKLEDIAVLNDATFFQVPGLADPTKVSFQSKNFPDRYIRHENFKFLIVPFADTDVYKEDVTFIPASFNIDCSDSDGDGICDENDKCPDSDDTLDLDNDGVPDGCDVCSGSDDTVDVNDNDIPDGCEDDVQTFESINLTDYFITHQGIENQVKLILHTEEDLTANKESISFRVVAGLGDANGVSFESIDNPGYYLAHYNFLLKLRKLEDINILDDATFLKVPGLADPTKVSFESPNYPEYFIRHFNYEFGLVENDGSVAFKNDATFISSSSEFSIPVTGILISNSNLELEVGKDFILTVQVLPENATNKQVVWSIDDDEIAVVDAFGKVTAVSEGEAIVTVKTEDGDFIASSTVNVTATTEPSSIVYRLNAGGPLVASADDGPDWVSDAVSGGGTGSGFTVNTGTASTLNQGVSYASRHPSLPGYIDAGLYGQLFARERYDVGAAPEMAYSIPLADGEYVVNLYLGDHYSETSQVGDRVFGITLEGVPVRTGLDLVSEFGHRRGGMLSYGVTVSGGSLEVGFLHGAKENPLVNAIEVLGGTFEPSPLAMAPIADRSDVTGSGVEFFAVASGGDLSEQLSYGIEGAPSGISIDATTGSISGTVGGPAGGYTVRVTADRTGSVQVSTEFTWRVTEPSSIVYRLNAGGPLVASADDGPDWVSDAVSGGGTGSGFTVNTGTASTLNQGVSYASRHPSLPGYIDAGLYGQLFARERYDVGAAPEMAYSIPLADGEYVVNLYLGDHYSETSQVGDRVFGITLEGVPVRTGLDLVSEFGHRRGGMLSYGVTVSGGSLEVGFLHGAKENPLVNAIEVLGGTFEPSPLAMAPIADRSDVTGSGVEFFAVASGGDLSEQLSYGIEGAPSGISIDATTGSISGTVGGPAGGYTVRVTADRTGSVQVSTEFTWRVTEPSSIVYRLNAGGPLVASADDGPDWVSDAVSGGGTGSGFTVNTGTASTLNQGVSYASRHPSLPGYIDAGLYGQLFARERYDVGAAPEMAYSIPLADGEYVVNLYLGDHYSETSQVGDRVFGITLEGVPVRTGLDLVSEFGHRRGGMLSYGVTVSGGSLEVGFLHGAKENPLVNAIEVLGNISSPASSKNQVTVSKPLNNLKLYPNPAHIETTMSFDMPTTVGTIQVFDVTGRLVRTIEGGKIDERGTPVNVQEMPAGMYFVKTTDTSGTEFQQQMLIKRQ
ncbi:AbfB domain-containing protein [Maribacter sp. X9]|uniref:AbfB domain-containing protein n=1 Tax=Maribacter sp. X9 TaxID=3402159 RepID=UPI003AF3DA92